MRNPTVRRLLASRLFWLLAGIVSVVGLLAAFHPLVDVPHYWRGALLGAAVAFAPQVAWWMWHARRSGAKRAER